MHSLELCSTNSTTTLTVQKGFGCYPAAITITFTITAFIAACGPSQMFSGSNHKFIDKMWFRSACTYCLPYAISHSIVFHRISFKFKSVNRSCN